MNVKDILKKYGRKIEGQIETSKVKNVDYSQSYLRFKQEMATELTRYEKWCRSLGNIIKLKVSEKDKAKIQRQLDIAHLDIEP